MTQAKLLFWGARGLYLGSAFGLRAHRNAVAVLAISLDMPARLARDPVHAAAGYVAFRTALIPPNTLHHLCSPDGNRMAFVYVDALSTDYPQLHPAMRSCEPRFGLGHVAEGPLIKNLLALAGDARWSEVRDELSGLLGFSSRCEPDLRIAGALKRLHAAPSDTNGLAHVAGQTQLSPSRFLHLFKTQTGVPFRRYRTWVRIGAALKSMRMGVSLTEAAHDAGFSSSAHFSTTFTEMFGLPPSRLAMPRGSAAATAVQAAVHS